MVNTIYLLSFVETPRKFIIAELSIRKLGSSSVLIILLYYYNNNNIISTDEDPSLPIESSAIINLRDVSTKLNKYNVEKPGQKRVKQSEHLPPAKRPRTAARTTFWQSCPEFNFRHKFSLLVVGPTQSGKTYFVQQILEHNRIVYEEQKSIRIFWFYNQ